jgi:6-phosphogluconolactonase (cycloisomerase 2 family)
MDTRIFSLLAPLAPLALAGCSSPASASPSSSTESSALSAAEPTPEYGSRAEQALTLSNESSGNEVLVFAASGKTLTAVGHVATGGAGSGAGLGSQGALALSGDGRWLLAVNAGSNDVSLLRVTSQGLYLADIEPSGGTGPVSVTESKGLVYVLNAGATQNISGFSITNSGLLPLPDSTRPLSASASVGAAEVAFSPDGNVLVVTEKGTNSIDTYVVRRDGTPTAATTTASTGVTPYGFAFDALGALVVSDAAGGATGAGALTSYTLDGHAAPAVVTGPVNNGQAAPCWVAITPDNAFAYTTNTASGTISGYTIGAGGALALFSDGGSTASTGEGSKPADVTIDRNGKVLYSLEGGTGVLDAFAIGAGGTLTLDSHVGGLPAYAAGLVVR